MSETFVFQLVLSKRSNLTFLTVVSFSCVALDFRRATNFHWSYLSWRFQSSCTSARKTVQCMLGDEAVRLLFFKSLMGLCHSVFRLILDTPTI